MIKEDDWRIQGQEEYLKNKILYLKKYIKHSENWEHEHCEFCGEKISEFNEDLNEGFCTEDEKYWICRVCYEDFKGKFNWKIIKNE